MVVVARVKYYVYILVARFGKLLVRVSTESPKYIECVEDALLPDEGDCGAYRSLDEVSKALRRIMELWVDACSSKT